LKTVELVHRFETVGKICAIKMASPSTRSRTTATGSAQSHTSARGNAMRSGGGDEHDKIMKAYVQPCLSRGCHLHFKMQQSATFSANPASHRANTRYKEKYDFLFCLTREIKE
jgi:hypothetical protein